MRNIVEYPITFEEKMKVLNEMVDHYNPMRSGSIGGIQLSAVNAIRRDVVELAARNSAEPNPSDIIEVKPGNED